MERKSKYPAEVRERGVRRVFEQQEQHESQSHQLARLLPHLDRDKADVVPFPRATFAAPAAADLRRRLRASVERCVRFRQPNQGGDRTV